MEIHGGVGREGLHLRALAKGDRACERRVGLVTSARFGSSEDLTSACDVRQRHTVNRFAVVPITGRPGAETASLNGQQAVSSTLWAVATRSLGQSPWKPSRQLAAEDQVASASVREVNADRASSVFGQVSIAPFSLLIVAYAPALVRPSTHVGLSLSTTKPSGNVHAGC